MGELKKDGFSPSLQTNVCAPDPQKIVDLQVRHLICRISLILNIVCIWQ